LRARSNLECIAHRIASSFCGFSELKWAAKAVRTGSEAVMFARVVALSGVNWA